MKFIFSFFLACWLTCTAGYAQEQFQIELEELVFPSLPLPGIHSGAVATYNGRWLFIGGRTNGLHGFLPPLAFPSSGVNREVWVVDPATWQSWSASTDSLPDAIREAISSSNMQYQQAQDRLYMLGGYGWQAQQNNFATFHTLTAIDVPGLMNAVTSANPIGAYFRQLVDSNFAVTGGHLAKVDSTWLLTFGHRFDGIYDREDTTGFHTQTYTYAVRRFRLQDDGQNLAVTHLPSSVDTLNYRRRDYNLVPQIFPNGSFGYTAWSGVFQPGVNLPWLFPIDVQANSEQIGTGFDQLLANYHAAVLPIYDSTDNYMHTIFFGGEAQYFYDSLQSLVMDTLVPFVNTISRVTRAPDSTLQEYRLPINMPGLLGSNATFIPVDSAYVQYEIIRSNAIFGRQLVGHIVGGIESPEPNISDTDPSVSWASERIFAVYLNKNIVGVATSQQLTAPVRATAAPNPFATQTLLKVETTTDLPVKVELLSLYGARLSILYDGPSEIGGIRLPWDASKFPTGIYYVRTTSGSYRHVLRLLHIQP